MVNAFFMWIFFERVEQEGMESMEQFFLEESGELLKGRCVVKGKWEASWMEERKGKGQN